MSSAGQRCPADFFVGISRRIRPAGLFPGGCLQPAVGCTLLIMPFGQITRLEPAHGFGFIVDDSGLDWFFLEEGVRGGRLEAVWVGERVSFAAEKTIKGPRAVDVHHEQLD